MRQIVPILFFPLPKNPSSCHVRQFGSKSKISFLYIIIIQADLPRAIQAPQISLLSTSFNSGDRSKIDFIDWEKCYPLSLSLGGISDEKKIDFMYIYFSVNFIPFCKCPC